MRSSLFAAVALGPLCLVAAALPAQAQVSIGSNTTTPIATATASNGGPSDIDVTTSGTVQPTSGSSPAVTMNSNNSISNEGVIGFNNVDNSTAVLLQGGSTGNFINTGTVQNIEDFDPPDNNQDGVLESPLAKGTGRYGVRAVGTSPITGNISNGGSIFAEGNNSYGISIEAPVVGGVFNTGTIGVTGDHSFGLRTTAPITGAVQLTGQVSVSGQGSTAVSVGGDVTGALSVYSSVASNGYSTSVRSFTDTLLKTIEATPSEMQQAGPAMIVGASLGKGLYIGAPPPQTTATSSDDVDGDGLPDGAEGTGSVSIFGSAPALVVGGTNRDITLGAFGTGQNAYGIIIRGAVSAEGLYDGIPATAMQIGSTGGQVNVAGGFRLTGSISSQAYEAPSTGILFGAGANVPVFQNENSVGATILHSSLTTPTTGTANAILLQAGANVPSIVNYGTITATASGSSSSATAIRDQSGSVANILNQGAIAATVSAGVSGGTTTGTAVAIDLRGNTSGVTLTQSVNPSPIPLSGTVDANNVFTALTTTPASPSIVGDVLLGNGPNTVNLLSGSITGALSLGSGPASLTIDNDAAYLGPLTYTGRSLAVSVPNGSLTSTSATPIQASSLNVGAKGQLSIAVDPANHTAGGFLVSGPATIADGAKVGINLISTLTTPQTFVLVSSPQLNVGDSIQSALGTVPYITVASLSVDRAVGTLSVNLRQRTAAEAGLNRAESAALQAVLAAAPNDTGVSNALFAQADRQGFISVYDQLLPDYAGGVFRLASAASRAVSRASSDADGPWLQEITVGAKLSAGHGAVPYGALGLGVAGGMERDSRLGIVGVTGSLFTGDVRTSHAPGDNRASETQIEAGLTWHTDIGQLRLDGRAAGGYMSYNYRRELRVYDPSTGAVAVDRLANGSSNGWTLAGRFGGSYRAQFGRWYLQPEAHLDYFRMAEGGYTEQGGGQAFDLTVAQRLSQEGSATVSVRAGGSFGRDFTWRPELELGYREILTGDPGVTTAHFAGGQNFTLDPADIQKGGAFGRFGFAAGNDLYDVSIAAGAEMRPGYTEGDVKFRLRLLF